MSNPLVRAELDAMIAELTETVDEAMAKYPPCQDVEVKEQTSWLALADAICHEAYRRKPCPRTKKS